MLSRCAGRAGWQALLLLSLISAAANGLTVKELKASGALLDGVAVTTKRVSNSQQIIAALKQLKVANLTNLILLSKTEEVILDETIVLGANTYSNNVLFVLEGNAKGKRVSLRCGKAKTALLIKAEAVFGNVDITGCTESAIVVDITRPECTEVYLEKEGLYSCDSPLRLIHMAVHGNSGKQGGGMYIQRGPVFMDMFEFKNNSAEEGGALYINQRACFNGGQGSSNRATNNFTGNSATRGGAVFFNDSACAWQLGVMDQAGNSIPLSKKLIKNLRETGKWVNTAQFMTFEGNHAELGGAMYVVQRLNESEDLVLYKLFFYYNMATKRGGAVYLEDVRAVIAADAVFKGNRAGLAGGAVWASSTIYGTLTMQGGTLRDNKVDLALLPRNAAATIERDAGNGGAVYAAGAINYNSTLKAKYINNTAPMNGGALHCSWCVYIRFESSYVINNTACSGGGMALDSVAGPSNISSVGFLGNRAECLPALEVAEYSRAATGQVSSESALICGSGGGGGACVRSLSLLKLNRNNFTSNRATTGGALYITQDACASTSAPCNVTVTSQRFEQNFARSAGGAVYLTSLTRVTFPLPPLTAATPSDINSSVTSATSDSLEFAQSCHKANMMHKETFAPRAPIAAAADNVFAANDVGPQGYGPTVATAVSCILQTKEDINVAGQDVKDVVYQSGGAIYKYQSGQPGPAQAIEPSRVRVIVPNDERFMLQALPYDTYGQRVTTDLSTVTITVTSISNKLAVLGPTNTTTTAKGVQLRNLTLYSTTLNQAQDVVIQATQIDFQSTVAASATILAIVRQCRVGSVTTGNSCKNCIKNQYTFNAEGNEGSCFTCPKNGNCTGPTLVPLDGYWHASPRSSNLHLCPFKHACKCPYGGPYTLPPGNPFPGPFSNTCDEFGRINLLRSAQKQLAGSGTNLTDLEVEAYNQLQCRDGYTGIVCGNCVNEPGRRRFGRKGLKCEKCSAKWKTLVGFVGLKLVEGLIVAFMVAARMMVSRPVGPQQANARHMAPTETMDDPQVVVTKDANDDEEQAVEISCMATTKKAMLGAALEAATYIAALLEVVVVYVQVLGLLNTSEVNWPYRLNTFLQALRLHEVSYIWLSPDCLLPQSAKHIAIWRVMIICITPALSTLALVAIWLALVTFRRSATATTCTKLLQTAIMVSVSSATFYYPSIVNALMSIFTCIGLDGEQKHNVIVSYGGLPSIAASSNGWWKQDYSTPCFKGAHSTFAFAFGIPMLLLVAIGVPCYITYFLWHHHRKGELKNSDFEARFGFMYADFEDGCWFWFCMRFWLLLTLSAAIQGLSYFGAMCQLIVVAVCLSVFIMLHLSARPYKSGLVNIVYFIMLYAVLITVFLSFIYVSDEAASTLPMALIILLNGATLVAQLLLLVLGIFGFKNRAAAMASHVIHTIRSTVTRSSHSRYHSIFRLDRYWASRAAATARNVSTP